MSNIETIIEQLYKSHRKSYISGYGGDLAISILIIYVYTVAIMYYYVINHIPELRKENGLKINAILPICLLLAWFLKIKKTCS